MKTYGTLSFERSGAARGAWLLTVQPHVAIRVKRLFPRVSQSRSGVITIVDSDEVARDLEWLTDRFPLAMDDATRKRLTAGADGHRDRDETIVRILTGSQKVHGLREPAREPRDYQRVASDLVISTGRLLITDAVGLGKSMTGTLVLRAEDALPALVVTMTHLPDQWEREIAATLPWLKTHIVQRSTPYDLTGAGPTQAGLFDDPDDVEDATRQPDVIIVPYSKLARWADHLTGTVNTVIFDEMQELRRHTSQKYTAAAMVADQATYRCGLTASPVYNYGSEIHSVISVLDRDALGSRDEFLREWGAGYQNDPKARVADPAALGEYLRDQGLMLGRTRQDVGRELPAEVRIPQQVNADPDAIDALAGDAAEMARLILSGSATSKERFQASGELDWKLRQATGIAKAPYVAEFVRMLLETERNVVLFGWHRACYELWAERLAEFKPVFYTGTETPAKKAEAAQAFIDGDSRVLVMSLRSGAGLDGLQEVCNVAVFGELDWSPQVHDQAIGRLRRDGQTEPTLAYFLHADEGSDPVVLETLQLKRAQSEPILDPDRKTFAAAADPDRIKKLAAEVLRRAGGQPADADAA